MPPRVVICYPESWSLSWYWVDARRWVVLFFFFSVWINLYMKQISLQTQNHGPLASHNISPGISHGAHRCHPVTSLAGDNVRFV